MNYYIIDGNNLIGRIKSLQQIQKKDKQASREQLIYFLNRHFAGKKVKLSLHLDGHPNLPLSISKGKITYSFNQPSDNFIRKEIEISSNPRLITLVTSDHSLMNFGKVCGCKVISADDFYRETEKSSVKNDEAEKINQLEKNNDEFLKLFQNKKR
ncbi:MAG: NYN domain-containing protein [Ignavibacteriales bacterium]|nr:NYN domain-containing protein [Ignavibacteriales bacterium]